VSGPLGSASGGRGQTPPVLSSDPLLDDDASSLAEESTPLLDASVVDDAMLVASDPVELDAVVLLASLLDAVGGPAVESLPLLDPSCSGSSAAHPSCKSTANATPCRREGQAIARIVRWLPVPSGNRPATVPRSMKIDTFLEAMIALAGSGVLASGCAKATRQSSEVPAAPTSDANASERECLHSEGCCGGHTRGDASCCQDQTDTRTADAKRDASTSAAWSRTWTVAPGEMAEINLELAAGDTMAARFSTDGGVLSWNVHSHEGNEAIIHAKGDAASGRPEHTAAKPGMYSFLWHNSSRTPVRLTVTLELGGAAKVHSTHPAE
jgi:hypothetical protein